MSTTTTTTPTTTKSTGFSSQDYYNFLATSTSGGVANAVSRTVVAPFERARLQMSVDPSHYRSMIDCIYKVSKSEGVGGLWRGNVLNVIRIYPQGAISFLLKDTAQIIYPKWFADSSLANPTSAMIAGGVSMSLVYPLDYVRVRMTVLPKGFYKSWWDGLKQMYHTGGINALYEGLKYSNYWAMIYYGVQFTVYDQMKAVYMDKWLKGYRGVENPSIDPLTGLVFGAIAGCICMTTAYPLEAIRRKLQVQGMAGRPVVYTGARDCARKIIGEQGWRGLYIGLGANMTKTPLSIGVTFGVYEWMMKRVFKTEMKKI